MGHANLTNLSELFINRLYAKGRLTIGDAIAAAVKRGETLHASEGEYEEEEMLGLGFMDVIAFLHSRDGRDYSGGPGTWEGPFIVPDWDVCKVPKGADLTSNIEMLTARCRKVQVAYIPMNTVWEERELFGVCADAIQDAGNDDWAELVRHFPKAYRAYEAWDRELDEYHDNDMWEDFDRIRWVFAPGWRKRYRDVPRLSSVTH